MRRSETQHDRRPPRGPEPLRRKRVEPVPAATTQRRKLLNLLLGFATLVLLVDSLVGEKGLMERMRARQQYRQAAAALESARSRNQGLREEALRLRDDPAAIEMIAREELGLIRPGEVLFIIRDAKPYPVSR